MACLIIKLLFYPQMIDIVYNHHVKYASFHVPFIKVKTRALCKLAIADTL